MLLVCCRREFFDEAGQRLHHDSTQAEVHYVPLLEEGEEPGALPEPANMTVADLEARLTILPGVQRVLARKDLAGLDSAQSLIEHWDHSVEPDHALPPENRGDGLREYLYPAEKPEDITQWDLRARMDWFARMRKGAAGAWGKAAACPLPCGAPCCSQETAAARHRWGRQAVTIS